MAVSEMMDALRDGISKTLSISTDDANRLLVLGGGVVCIASLGAMSLGALGVSGPFLAALAGKDILGAAAAMCAAGVGAQKKAVEAKRAISTRLERDYLAAIFRAYALREITALAAYFAIAIPLGLLVLNISTDMPVSACAIVAGYAYLGIARFISSERGVPAIGQSPPPGQIASSPTANGNTAEPSAPNDQTYMSYSM